MLSPKNNTNMSNEEKSAMVAKIDREANPEPTAHNYGQPLRHQYDRFGHERTKFFTDCSRQHAASLKCIEDNYTDRQVCQNFFDEYKKCRKEERKKRLEANAKSARPFW